MLHSFCITLTNRNDEKHTKHPTVKASNITRALKWAEQEAEIESIMTGKEWLVTEITLGKDTFNDKGQMI